MQVWVCRSSKGAYPIALATGREAEVGGGLGSLGADALRAVAAEVTG
jgi:hypothetical protein